MNGDNANSHVLFGMNGRTITTTMINGKVLMKDRELLHVDEEAIMAKSRETAKALADRINNR